MNLSHRSQSALEYMMTYGWAILIIVIVAVILYSMGIFNPSSAITLTSSGFSPFVVSSVICNPAGLTIAVTGGPIPNNANSATINGVYFTSNTGTTAVTGKLYSVYPVTVTSGSNGIIQVPNVVCTAAGTKVSLTANLQYTYDVPSIGIQRVNTTGTIAGTSSSSTLPITVDNTQSTATPSPFQQMVSIPISYLTSYTNASGSPYFGQNIEFTYGNGTVISSWLESYNNGKAIWWLKFNGGIPASSSITIYIKAVNMDKNLFNTTNDGEAPTLSATYGEYDNGANVFSFYDNFAGTTLPSGWVASLVGSGTYTINNGITLSTTNGVSSQLQFQTTSFNPQTQILDIYGAIQTYGFQGFGGGLLNSSATDSIGSIAIMTDIGALAYLVRAGGSTEINFGISTGNTLQLMSMWESTSTLYGTINYTDLKNTTSGFTPETALYPTIDWAERNVATSTEYAQYIRIRAYPPNGVMPSVTFGSIS